MNKTVLLLLVALLAASQPAVPSSPSSVPSASSSVSILRMLPSASAPHVAFGPPPLLTQALLDPQIEQAWHPAYLALATGDPTLRAAHGVYGWPFSLDSIGWSMQSYQDYGTGPYFHHGMDMMKMYGTNVNNRSGGQVINIENYQPGWDLYWEVAVLDPDGYIWQYHHVDSTTIPQYIWDKFAEYQADPVNGGFIPANTYLGNIIEWPVWSFGKQFNHIHLNILAAGGVFVNGFAFHIPLPDTAGPQIQAVGLLQNGQMHPDNEVEGPYSLYLRARDLILDDVYYLPPYDITFTVDGGPAVTTWRFDTLPGGASDTAYLADFYLVPPTCGNYECRDYYIDLGFIPGSEYSFPTAGGEHTVVVTIRDYAGNTASQTYSYTVLGTPAGIPIWQDDFELDRGWAPNPYGTDTAVHGLWERGDPEPTSSLGPKQLGDTTSGLNDLVTGRLAGGSASSNDVDGGVTSVLSPPIALPALDDVLLSFRFYLAHSPASTAADYFRVSLVTTTTVPLFEEPGAGVNDDAAWSIRNISLTPYAGQTVRLLFTAADLSSDNLLEAAVDDLLILDTSTDHAPTASPLALSTPEDTPLDLHLTASDLDGDPLSYTLVTTPAHGTLTGAPPALTYTPAPDYNGLDSFTFVVSDGLHTSPAAPVTVTITAVNDSPVALPLALTAHPSLPVSIILAGYDPEGDPLTFTLLTLPAHGTLSGAPPILTYAPAPSYAGRDSFLFVAGDGQLTSDPATVTISIQFLTYLPLIAR